MRTTIHLPDDLYAEIKKLSGDTRRTVTSLIEEALREKLTQRGRKPRPQAVRLTTFGKGGVQPGVDLDDSASLADLMEADRAADGR